MIECTVYIGNVGMISIRYRQLIIEMRQYETSEKSVSQISVENIINSLNKF